MIVRSTTNSAMNSMTDRLMKTQAELYKTQQKASDQKNILSISEDPVGTSIILDANKDLDCIDSFSFNIEHLTQMSAVMESTFNSIIDKLQTIDSLSVTASDTFNGTKETMNIYHENVKSLKEDIVRLANAQYKGNYLFGGTNTSRDPFVLAEDGSITYQGTKSINADGSLIENAEERYEQRLEVSKGNFMSANLPGDIIFGYTDNSTDPPQGIGLFHTLNMIEKATDPENFDTDAVRAQLDNLAEAIDTVSSYRSLNGIVQAKLGMLNNSLEDAKLLTTERRSNVQDADAVEIYSKLTKDYYAYQASMQIMSNMMGASLLNYL